MSIAVDALGPKEEAARARFFDYLRMQQNNAPASERDRLFIQVCGKKPKKGLTHSEAEQQVRELRQQLALGVPRPLEEVESLVSVIDSLLDEYADADNVKDYEMRKVPHSVVIAAVVQLADTGISAAEIEDDFDLVAAEILKLRPSLARS